MGILKPSALGKGRAVGKRYWEKHMHDVSPFAYGPPIRVEI